MKRMVLVCLSILGLMLMLGLVVVHAQDADIYAAATSGDLTAVQKMIGATPKLLDAVDNDGRTALLYACSWGHLEMVKWLLEKGAQINMRDKDGRIPLHWAAGMGHKDVVELLLANKADLTVKDKDGRTPRELAAAKGQDDVATRLQEAEKSAARLKPIYPTRINPIDSAEMVLVPAGEFLMGGSRDKDPGYEKPAHKVFLDAFWVYKTVVTVAQYREYCRQTNHRMPSPPAWGWTDNYPIVKVTYTDAIAYAKWAGGFLPTEAQWEKAARGADGNVYPWGDTWDVANCNCMESGLTKPMPVGSYPGGASPYGALDMAGNVDQWCLDWYDTSYYPNSPTHNPKGPDQAPDPAQNGNINPSRVRRGGNFTVEGEKWMYCAHRKGIYPDSTNEKVGFRVILPAMGK